MRRPRGPGGRFLTAEEIAAQKQPLQDEPGPSTCTIPDHDFEDEPEDDEPKPNESSASPAPEPDVFISHQPPSDPIQAINFACHPIVSLLPQSSSVLPVPSVSEQPQSRPTSSPVTVFSRPQQQHQSQNKGSLVSPYVVQMHHVPHPHAHARHHHSNISSYIYTSDSVSSTGSVMQRRTEDMIQFGASPSSS